VGKPITMAGLWSAFRVRKSTGSNSSSKVSNTSRKWATFAKARKLAHSERGRKHANCAFCAHFEYCWDSFPVGNVISCSKALGAMVGQSCTPSKLALCEPSCVLDWLREAVSSSFGV